MWGQLLIPDDTTVVVTPGLTNRQTYPASYADATLGSSGTVTLKFNSNGSVSLSQDPDVQWYAPETVDIGNDFEVRASNPTGAFVPQIVGTFGTWLPISSAPEWSYFTNAGGFQSSQFDLEFRDTATQTLIPAATAVGSLSIEVGGL